MYSRYINEMRNNGIALPTQSYFGMITFSDKIGIYNFSGSFPHLLNILIPSSGEDCSVGIEDLLHVNNMLIQVLFQ